jgi:hypothetical protein
MPLFEKALGVVGWDRIEPVILIALAENVNVCFVGNHGGSKTSVCKRLAFALKGVSKKFQQYDCPNVKHDEIFGITDIKALTEGTLRYIKHPQSIWDKDVILWSEINRPNPMLQSKLNEIILDGSVHGKKTNITWQFADANPSAKYEAFYLQPQLAARLFFVETPKPNSIMFDAMMENEALFNGFDFPEIPKESKEDRDKRYKEHLSHLRTQVSDLGKFFFNLCNEKITEADMKFASDMTKEVLREMNDGSNGDTFPLSMREAKRLAKMLSRTCAYARVSGTTVATLVSTIEQIILGHIPHYFGMLSRSYDHQSVIAAARVVFQRHVSGDSSLIIASIGDPINLITKMLRDEKTDIFSINHLKDVLNNAMDDVKTTSSDRASTLARYLEFTCRKRIANNLIKEDVCMKVCEAIIDVGYTLFPMLCPTYKEFNPSGTFTDKALILDYCRTLLRG